MGVGSIGTRTAGSFGVTKANQAAITKPEKQLAAGEYNRLADAVIEIQQAIGTSIDPGDGSHEERINGLGAGEMASALAGRAGRFDGEFRRCSGVGSVGVGPGTFRWHEGDATAANGGTVLGAGSGRWKRVFDGTVFEVSWFGAVAGDVGDQAPAIQSAIDAAAAVAASNRARVVVRGGVYRTAQKVVAADRVTLEFVDASIHATADCGIECSATKYGVLLSPHLRCDAGVSGIIVVQGGDYTRDLRIIRPVIDLATTGSAVGIDFVQVGTGTGGADVHYFPLIEDPTIHVTAGSNYGATAIRHRGAPGTFSRCVGGRVIGGTIENVGHGVDVDNCDTFIVDKTRFVGVKTAANSACVTLGARTRDCGVQYPRVEDCDRILRTVYDGSGPIAATYPFLLYPEEVNTTDQVILDSGPSEGATNPHFIHNGYVRVSKTSASMMYQRRQSFMHNIEFGAWTDLAVASGATLRDAVAGAVSPHLRIVASGSPGAFSLGSINREPDTDSTHPYGGMLVCVQNTLSVTMTILHDDGGTSDAWKRIKTMSGSNESVQGPSFSWFFFDYTRAGSGAQRFVYLGSFARAAAAQADSVAVTLGDLVADFNSLLAKLRAAGLLKA